MYQQRTLPSLALFLLFASHLPLVSALQNQPIQPPNHWQESTQAKLRGIYEQALYRPHPWNAKWTPDSSGYFLTTSNQSPTFHPVDPSNPTPNSSPSATPSPDHPYQVEYQANNLSLRNRTDNSLQPVTSTHQPDIVYHQPKWSPHHQKLLFTESDETNVRKRNVLLPTDPSYPDIRQDRFARVGEAIPKLRIGVFHLDSQELQWLSIDQPAEGYYLGQVEWAGNDHEVLIETLSRFRDQHSFYLVDTQTNQASRIYSETNAAWADASQGKNQGLIWLRHGSQFLLLSEKDGWRHAYLHSRDGKEIANLTPGDYDIIDRGTIDEDLGYFYFFASPNNATQKYLYRVPLDGSGTSEQVTPKDLPGTHDYHFSPNAKFAFHTYSTFNALPIVDLIELPSHRSIRVLESNPHLHDIAQSLASNPTEFLQLDLGHGLSADAWLMKPPNFDPSKKYPVLVYVYGEPHAQTVLDAWGTAHHPFHRVVADLGYLVLSIDNRGTPAPKGAAWRRSIFGSLGPLSTEEQATALQALAASHPFVDLSRVGIWGWSGGGSNTLNAMFRKPDLYHVGIAVVPKPQPHLYNAWFQEIYMRTPEVNPDGYLQSAPIHFASGLQGKLLIITGSGETNTHIQIIEGLVNRLIELGKPFDYMVYPNRDHGLREGPGSEVHVRMLILRYLLQHLPPGPQSTPNP